MCIRDRFFIVQHIIQYRPRNFKGKLPFCLKKFGKIHRTSVANGDAALALDLHEVRRGAFLDLVAFDRPGDVDGTAEELSLIHI